jgi:hypothetical protein
VIALEYNKATGSNATGDVRYAKENERSPREICG